MTTSAPGRSSGVGSRRRLGLGGWGLADRDSGVVEAMMYSQSVAKPAESSFDAGFGRPPRIIPYSSVLFHRGRGAGSARRYGPHWQGTHFWKRLATFRR